MQKPCGWPQTSGEGSKGEREGSRTAPMEEGRGAVSHEKGGLHPRRGLVPQQGKKFPQERDGRRIPQAFPAQKKRKLFTVFMKDQEHAVEQLVRYPRFPLRFGDGSIRFQAKSNECQESGKGIRKKGDHIHGQDGMGAATGTALEAQDLAACFKQLPVLP